MRGEEGIDQKCTRLSIDREKKITSPRSTPRAAKLAEDDVTSWPGHPANPPGRPAHPPGRAFLTLRTRLDESANPPKRACEPPPTSLRTRLDEPANPPGRTLPHPANPPKIVFLFLRTHQPEIGPCPCLPAFPATHLLHASLAPSPLQNLSFAARLLHRPAPQLPETCRPGKGLRPPQWTTSSRLRSEPESPCGLGNGTSPTAIDNTQQVEKIN